MFDWVRKKKSTDPLKAKLDEMEKLIVDLKKQVEAWGPNSRVHVNIENVHLDRPVLEQLVFHLDSLDVKELSGSLNLGNNFGLSNSKEKVEPAKQAFKNSPPDHKPADSKKKPEMNASSSGFSIKI